MTKLNIIISLECPKHQFNYLLQKIEKDLKNKNTTLLPSEMQNHLLRNWQLVHDKCTSS